MPITVYDPNPVPVTYTNEELKIVVNDFLNSIETEFSFSRLSAYVLERAIIEKKVRNAETTQYSNRNLNPRVSIEVSRLLWELIWEKKIFIVFGNNPYIPQNTNDVRFMPNK